MTSQVAQGGSVSVSTESLSPPVLGVPRVCEYSVKSQRTAHRGSPWCPQQWGSPVMGTPFNILAAGVTVICHQPPIILKPPTVAQHHRACSCYVGALLGPHRYPRGEVNCQPGDPMAMGSPLTEFEIGLGCLLRKSSLRRNKQRKISSTRSTEPPR